MAELSSRERVRRALNHQEPDRVPIDIGGMSTLTTLHLDAYKKLKQEFGLKGDIQLTSMPSQSVLPDEEIRKRFKADCYPLSTMWPDGGQLNPNIEGDGSRTYTDEWGVKWRQPKNGMYFDAVGHPLLDCTVRDIEAFNWPDPKDRSRIAGLGDRAKGIFEQTDYALVMNGPLYGGVYVPCQWLMGFEEFFIKLIIEPEVVRALLDKVVEYHIGQWDAILDEAGKYIEAVVITDDLGTQTSPIMKPSTYRNVIKPAHRKIISFIKSKADVKVIFHSDGAIKEFMPDLVEIGCDALNPIQISAEGMDDTKKLKEEYGDKLVFWGGACESQSLITNGSVIDIRLEVERRINDLAPGGGLIAGSIHSIQKDAPVENMIAFYDALLEFGSRIYKK
ncbi:MAG: uroporphyrinogen-III decarboxylase [Tindallia sp. MSAO_Bac2]|nr:MAG: uroporphyrinogen-III decarboxylase [Tindallia sp. MSAO_Bac2]